MFRLILTSLTEDSRMCEDNVIFFSIVLSMPNKVTQILLSKLLNLNCSHFKKVETGLAGLEIYPISDSRKEVSSGQ